MNHWNTIRQDGPHGVLRIYDPARFGTNKHNNPYQGNSWPGLTPVFPNQFPFPAPLYFNEGTALELKPLSESRFRTAARSRTSTASKITQLHTEGGQGDLQFVSMSDGLASRLAWYGEGRPQLPSTWPSNINPARRLPVAQAQQQIHAIYLLWAWFQGHSFPSRNRIVNGEPAVQDQVLQQLIEPLNIFLQNWYQNRHVVNQNLHEHGYDKPAFYPLWRRAVPADHRERDHANAGFPDFFLTTEQERTGASSAAVIEVKTFWSFDAQDVWDIFSNRTIPNGIMSWEGDTPYSKILKQVWGEMVFFTCHWAAWMNGHYIIFMVRTNHDSMVCSCPVSWTDPYAIWAMVGFTLASIDSIGDPALLNHMVGNTHIQWPAARHLVEDLDVNMI